MGFLLVKIVFQIILLWDPIVQNEIRQFKRKLLHFQFLSASCCGIVGQNGFHQSIHKIWFRVTAIFIWIDGIHSVLWDPIEK